MKQITIIIKCPDNHELLIKDRAIETFKNYEKCIEVQKMEDK